MKKILFLTPILIPFVASAQYVGIQTPEYYSPLIIFIVSAVILFIYFLSSSKIQNIKEFFKAFIDREILVVSLFCACLFVFLSYYNLETTKELAQLSEIARYGNIMYIPKAESIFQEIVKFTSFSSLVLPPFYFVFTRGWRHFIACFIDTIVLALLVITIIANT